MRSWLFVIVLVLAGTTAQAENKPVEQERLGPLIRMRGIYHANFEIEAFRQCTARSCPDTRLDTCWLRPSKSAQKEMQAMLKGYGPKGLHWGRDFELLLEGRKAEGLKGLNGRRYGHLGGYPCEIRAEHVLSVRPVPTKD